MKKSLLFSFLTLCSLMCLQYTIKAQSVKFNHTYGSMAYNFGKRIIETSDRGFYMMGNVSAVSGNTNISIIKTDSLGIILSEKIIGDASLYWANDFIRTSDKGYLISGFTNKHPENGYDMLLIKTDSNINIEWERYYGGSDWDIANAVVETKDNAYLMVGQTYSYGAANGNIYIVKTNYLGDTLWTRTFGGDSADYAMSADVLFDSTYLIGATTKSFGFGDYDAYVINLNKNGDTIWTKNYGQDKEDIIYSIKQSPDSGFVFVGSTTSYNAIGLETWLMKFDKNRNYIWKLPEFWDIKNGDQLAYNINFTDSAHFLITGYTTALNGSKDLSLIIMRDFANFKFSITSSSLFDDAGYQAIQTADKGFAIVGYTEGFGTALSNFFVVKIGNDCSYSTTYEHILDVEEPPIVSENDLFGIYPNISEGKYNINLKESNSKQNYDISVINVVGQEIFRGKWETSLGDIYKIDISNAADGMYFVTVASFEIKSSFMLVKSSK